MRRGAWDSRRADPTRSIRSLGCATWVTNPVNVDGNLITSHNPKDMPAFSAAILAALAHRA